MKKKAIKLLCMLICAVLVLSCALFPSAAEEQYPNLNLNCRAAVLMEAESGRVLYEANADEALPPASVTKVMTLLLVMEALADKRIALGDTVSVSERAASMGGSQIFLEIGETMSVEDMLKSVIIASANDAALALAEHIAGTEEAFVEQMNRRAAELGMKNTSFENTNGLDDTTQNHLISARDIAIMSRELIKHDKITEYSSIWQDSIRDGEFTLTNTNRLIRYYKGATGLKTGSTSKAGFCISATATRDGMTLIAVVMGAPTRDIRNACAVSLLDYGFSNYTVFRNSERLSCDIPMLRGKNTSVHAEESELCTVVKKGSTGKVDRAVIVPDRLSAPVKSGETVGSVVYSVDGVEIGRTDIKLTESVDEVGFFDIFIKLLAALTLC